MPLPVTEDTPPDMLAGAMELKVLLPNGRTVAMSVERSTPMMDLLVQLTTAHKLSLAGHMTVALSESGAPLHHLPSTPVGALDTRLLHVVARANNATLQRARPAQPFQTTFRLQVHLPRNQLFVTRVSASTRLADVLRVACVEKNLDPAKYELRHPANLQEQLLLTHTLGDYRLQEVTMVARRSPGAPLTPADIMALHKQEEKRRQQVKANGSTAYNLPFNKSRTNVQQVQSSGSVSSDSLNGRSISPARSDESVSRSVSPLAPEPPKRLARKRRPAPKPPGAPNQSGEPPVPQDGVTNHSRTSSDSSGYHEASVLSETADSRANGDSSGGTLPRRSKLPSTNHIAAKQHSNTNHSNLSRSLSNLTATVGIRGQSMHSASTTSLASQGQPPRRKKAAPPPPPGATFKKPGSVSTVTLPSTAKPTINETIPETDRETHDEAVPNGHSNVDTTAVAITRETVIVTLPRPDLIDDNIVKQDQLASNVQKQEPVEIGVQKLDPVETDTQKLDPVESSVIKTVPIEISRPTVVIESSFKKPVVVETSVEKSVKVENSVVTEVSTVVKVTKALPVEGSAVTPVPVESTTMKEAQVKSDTVNASPAGTAVIQTGPASSVNASVVVGVKPAQNREIEVPMPKPRVLAKPQPTPRLPLPTTPQAVVPPVTTRNQVLTEKSALELPDENISAIETAVTDNIVATESDESTSPGNPDNVIATQYYESNNPDDSVGPHSGETDDVVGTQSGFPAIDCEASSMAGWPQVALLVAGDRSTLSLPRRHAPALPVAEDRNTFPRRHAPAWQANVAQEQAFDSYESGTSLEEWEYHLPAPPSAFRDLNSPTTTDFETIRLAETLVFHDATDVVPTATQHAIDVTRSTDNSSPTTKHVVEQVVDISQLVPNVNAVTTAVPLQTSTQCVPPTEQREVELVREQISTPVEQRTMDIVREQRSTSVEQRTVDVVPDASWEPQMLRDSSSLRGKFNNGDLRLGPDGVTKEVFKVNPIFDSRPVTEARPVLDQHEIIERSKRLITRSSTSDLSSSHSLKNFTISSYEKPKNLLDTTFREPLPLARTNSYNNQSARPNTVKRSTSYISLVRPHIKPFVRTKSISNLVLEEEAGGGSGLRKTSSELDVSHLASLNVMKSILPQISQVAITSDVNTCTDVAAPNDVMTQPDLVAEQSAPTENSTSVLTEVTKPVEATQPAKVAEPVEPIPSKPEAKPFVYLGPPAINFGSWSERPRGQVSLKSDRDYRIGRQGSSTNLTDNKQATSSVTVTDVKPAVSSTNFVNVKSASRSNNYVDFKSANSYSNLTEPKPSGRFSNIIDINTAFSSKEDISDLRLTKIEPTPLTMRIVSHTTTHDQKRNSFGPNRASSTFDINDVESQGRWKEDSDVSRLPIVRAVELKKTASNHFVQLRNKSSTLLNGSTDNVAQVSVNYPGAFNRHSYIEGVNVNVNQGLSKSVSSSELNVETPNNNQSSNKLVNLGNKKYTSVVGINRAQVSTARPNFSTISFTAKPMPTVKGFRMAEVCDQEAVSESNTVKSQPLKTINGIEQLRAKTSWSQRNSTNEKTVVEPSWTQRKLSNEKTFTDPMLNQRNSFNEKNVLEPSWSQRSSERMVTEPSWTQRNSFSDKAVNNNSTLMNDRIVSDSIPEPPKPPVMIKFKKPVQRPLEKQFTNPRDALMDAIKNFGGQDALMLRNASN